MYKSLNINSLREYWPVKLAKKCALRSQAGESNNCGVLYAINRVFAVLQKAIREQLGSYYITAFCMVHSQRDGKAALCRP